MGAMSSCLGALGCPVGARAARGPGDFGSVMPGTIGTTVDADAGATDGAKTVQHSARAVQRTPSDGNVRGLLRAVSNLSGAPVMNEQRSREDLIEAGMPAQQAGNIAVQAHMAEVSLVMFARFLALFGCVVCLLFPAFFVINIWFLYAFFAKSGNCDGPLRLWGIVVLLISLFNATLNKDAAGGSLVRKFFCNVGTTYSGLQHEPARVQLWHRFSSFVLPLGWNCMGIYWASVDSHSETPCQESAPGYYTAAKTYAIFTLVFTAIVYVGIAGIMAFCAFLVQRGLVGRTKQAACPKAIDTSCTAVELNGFDAKNNPSCSICLIDFAVSKKPMVKTNMCGHIFHKDCLKNWLKIKAECPLCRAGFPAPGGRV